MDIKDVIRVLRNIYIKILIKTNYDRKYWMNLFIKLTNGGKIIYDKISNI